MKAYNFPTDETVKASHLHHHFNSQTATSIQTSDNEDTDEVTLEQNSFEVVNKKKEN